MSEIIETVMKEWDTLTSVEQDALQMSCASNRIEDNRYDTIDFFEKTANADQGVLDELVEKGYMRKKDDTYSIEQSIVHFIWKTMQ